MNRDDYIIGPDAPILVTGATGFIGFKVIENLLDRGFRNLVCFTRPTSELTRLEDLISRGAMGAKIQLIAGNLLSREDCSEAAKDASVIFHLAAGGSDKSYPDAFMNSVVTTRNLLDASLEHKSLRRFVNISSLAVYSNRQKRNGRVLDESSPIETHPELRGDAYCFAKIKQDDMVTEYGRKFGIPYIIVRPGYVYGPGKDSIASRVGIDTFGVFLHLGGSNAIPLTYVDNCADAIVMAGLKTGVDGDVFNVIDNDLPSSRRFLRLYKRNVRDFTSIYVPHIVSRAFCCAWEKYSRWSEGQLPPAFNNRRWHAFWKKTRYSNAKLKSRVGWAPKVPLKEGLELFFESCRNGKRYA